MAAAVVAYFLPVETSGQNLSGETPKGDVTKPDKAGIVENMEENEKENEDENRF